MSIRLFHRVAAGVLATTLALASPVLARGGGGMGGGGGGMHAMGGMGGGMHAMGGGMHPMGGGMMGGGMHPMGGGMHFAAIGPGPHWTGAHFSHAAFSPRFGFHHHFFHHRRFFFVGVGAPFFYADYDSCWRRYWTAYGLQWVNVCGNYTY